MRDGGSAPPGREGRCRLRPFIPARPCEFGPGCGKIAAWKRFSARRPHRNSSYMRDDFKYEAVFSFVQKDEQLALQIADRIRDRLSVFVYSEHQEVFVGTDGVDQHTRIYEDEARVVVVLHREEWGQTNWTRVEETAIRNRGFKEGYDFLVFVPLDNSNKPKWLPKTRIWVGLQRYGIDGVANAIETTVQTEGGAVSSESVVDYALRLERRANFKDKRERWRGSEEGVAAAEEEVKVLYGKLKELALEVTKNSERFQMRYHADDRICSIVCRDCNLIVRWVLRARNNLHGAELRVNLIRQVLDQFFRSYSSEQMTSVTYEADIDFNENIVWKEAEGSNHSFTSTQLAEMYYRSLIEAAAAITDESEGTSGRALSF